MFTAEVFRTTETWQMSRSQIYKEIQLEREIHARISIYPESYYILLLISTFLLIILKSLYDI